MKVIKRNQPRKFLVGKNSSIEMLDTGTVILEENEQVTFKTLDGKEYDVAKKNWGYYATPSLAGRLKSFNFKPALMRSKISGHCYIILVQRDKINELEKYLIDDDQEIVIWLDDFEFLKGLKSLSRNAEVFEPES